MKIKMKIKMKKMITTTLILIGISPLANEDLHYCNQEYLFFGQRKMPTPCIEIYQQSLTGNKNKLSPSFKLLTTPNALFLLKEGKVHTQAGQYAKINSPLSSTFSPQENLIATLEEGGIVKIYNALIMGNTAPIKVFEDPRFYGAHDLVFTNEGLLILNPSNQKLILINHTAKVAPSLKVHVDVVKRLIPYKEKGIISIAYDHKGDHILLTNKEGQNFTIK